MLNFESLRQANARIEQLAELVIQFRALSELPGRDDQGHGARTAPDQVDTLSSLTLKSRLLRRPTI